MREGAEIADFFGRAVRAKALGLAAILRLNGE
jgi:hypothetical protein